LLPSPTDIIDGLEGISRSDQNQVKKLFQVQNTHTTNFKKDSDYDSEVSEEDEADGYMGGGLGMILEGKSIDTEIEMVSKVEEARISRKQEKRSDDHPPPQSAADKRKSSLTEDKIEEEIVSPLTHKSDTNRKMESDEDEGGDLYFIDSLSSDVLPPINPSPPKPTHSFTIDAISSTPMNNSSASDYDSYMNKIEYTFLNWFIKEMGRRSKTAGYEGDYLSSPRKGGEEEEKENLKLPDGMHPLTPERRLGNLYLYSFNQKHVHNLSIM